MVLPYFSSGKRHSKGETYRVRRMIFTVSTPVISRNRHRANFRRQGNHVTLPDTISAWSVAAAPSSPPSSKKGAIIVQQKGEKGHIVRRILTNYPPG